MVSSNNCTFARCSLSDHPLTIPWTPPHSSGLVVCRTAFPWMPPLQMDGLLYIRFLLHIPWDELWAIIRSSHFLMGGRSIEKLCILLRFTLQSTTNCPEVYLWPSTCRDLARGCICLLPNQNGFPSYEKYNIIAIWVRLIRLSPPCNDLLADIRNLWPLPKMDAFYIHNVLEWLKTFPQPPLDVIDRWQGHLDDRRRASHSWTSYYLTFKKCEERWTEFQKQIASRHQQEIQRWDGLIDKVSWQIVKGAISRTICQVP
ncbi:hypothetical protein FB451DRAFT_722548 [Mycena latifolia]|nr:hypothetical protein FB451DRAFT_722548 [Mycena latifolia]